MKYYTEISDRFSSFKLHSTDLRQIDQTINQLINKTCYDTQHNHEDKAWKVAARKQQLRIYRKLREDSTPLTSSDSCRTQTPSPSSSDSNLGTDPEVRIVHLEPQQKLVGCIPGTVEDFLCGLYAYTDVEWKQGSEHILTGALQSTTLSRVQTPTKTDPFRTRTIRWAMRSQKPVSSIFVRQRDFAFVEATGWKINSDGRRVGYYIMQSIRHPDLPELPSVCRAELSVCITVSSNESRSVCVHGLGAFDPKGSLSVKLSTRILARAMLGVSEAVNYAFMKKLLHTRIGRKANCVDGTFCDGCGRDIKVFFKSAGRVCRVCGIACCARCSVKLSFSTEETTEIKACLQCVVETHRISTWKFACDRIHRKEIPNNTDRLNVLIHHEGVMLT
uniref:Uncharacterized protein AlNc14C176G8135 n=1 Tax=Albugo laibachii Nc14 TaxID=890382 RepID=F0WNY0_9STRA|nr:conserved hypothetical protein [Albugo laibachii Nc14]|eukprot:CCA23023.1 conserved hypothetical protein [Albugo laibachii Nc14]